MIIRCIVCLAEWNKPTGHIWGPDDVSSSLCAPCGRSVLSKLIHRKQLLEGNWDCFGTAGGYCDQLGCKYREGGYRCVH